MNDTKEKHRRRWFQIGLKELMLAVTIAALSASVALLSRPFWTLGIAFGMALFGTGLVLREWHGGNHELFAIGCIIALAGAALLLFGIFVASSIPLIPSLGDNASTEGSARHLIVPSMNSNKPLSSSSSAPKTSFSPHNSQG